jgi:hypothetical protein
MLLAVCAGVALAGPSKGEGLSLETGGHIKTFFLAAEPLESDALGQATLAGRLQLHVEPIGGLEVDLHPVATRTVGDPLMGLSTGVEGNDGLRLDRAKLTLTRGPLRTTLGRQAFSHGQGRLFTPMDLIAPFTPATLDTEFRPGVDAARVEAFFGTATKVELIGAHLAAWDEDWDAQHGAMMATAQATLGTTDLGLFTAALHDDSVLGASAYSPIGPVGIYGDATLTLTGDEATHRVVLGTDLHPWAGTRVGLELYSQGFGADDPADYLASYGDARFGRGELWLVGHNYAGLTVGQALTPLVQLAAFGLVNLDDGSALLSSTLTWSAAESASLSLGLMAGLGEEEAMTITSEFGAIPLVFHAQSGLYF